VSNPSLSDAQVEAYIAALPDYRQFGEVLARRRVNVQRARNDALPTVDVGVGTGYTGFGTGYSDAYNRAFRSDLDYQALFEVRVPLGFGQERANLRKRNYELQIDTLRKQELAQQLRAQIREEARGVVAGNERVRVTESLLKLNDEQFEQLQAKFQQGLTNFREMLLVQDDLREANIRAVRAKLDAVEARIRLARYDGTLLERYGLLWGEPAKTPIREGHRSSSAK
jgi:outer membrane protein TolC